MPMKCIDFLAQFNIPSRERSGTKHHPASRSELRRWFEAGNVWINAETVTHDEVIDFPLISVVLFGKGKRITLW